MRISTIVPAFVEVIPEQLDDGILYISMHYRIAAHRCCCGCGEEVITPLTPADWTLCQEGKTVSLSPSIGNWDFRCKSHYWIDQNQVRWSYSFSEKQIAAVKARDKAEKAAYISYTNQQKEKGAGLIFVITKLWKALLRLLKLDKE